MRAVETGPVGGSAGKLNTVASSVLGWETVFNPTSAVLGRVAESDLQSCRQTDTGKNTVSVGGQRLPPALYERKASVLLAYRENYTDTPMAAGRSRWCRTVRMCVEGGEKGEIARALLRTKTIGAAHNGRRRLRFQEPVSGQTYTVKFMTALKRLSCSVA